MLKDIIEEIERHQRLLADENEESVKEMEEFQQTLPLMQDASFEKLKKRHFDNMTGAVVVFFHKPTDKK